MSRLDRLVQLLDTGSSSFVKNTAAQQLADIQKDHPDDLFNLLNRVAPYLKSKKWDTRSAAIKALGGIVANADPWYQADDTTIANENNNNKSPIKKEESDSIDISNASTPSLSISDDDRNFDLLSQNLLSFEKFDLNSVLTKGKKLLGSKGADFDFNYNDMNPTERLKFQKRNIASKLGLGSEYMEDDILTAADLMVPSVNSSSETTPTIKSEQSLFTNPNIDTKVKIETNLVKKEPHNGKVKFEDNDFPISPSDSTNILNSDSNSNPSSGAPVISRRMRAMAKRKAKADLRNNANKSRLVNYGSSAISSLNRSQDYSSNTSSPSTSQNANSDETSNQTSNGNKLIIEHKGAQANYSAFRIPHVSEGIWPLQGLYDMLLVDLFDESWETRHGAAGGLRELVKSHGKYIGRLRYKFQPENDLRNQAFLEDLACRIFCIFALDRFGDYVSDQVVAPIRESAAQIIGVLLIYLNDSKVFDVFNILYELVMQNNTPKQNSMIIWEASHGGMLGLKYLVSVRLDSVLSNPKLFDGLIECIIRALSNSDDDVRAVSAATLIPIADDFVKHRYSELDKVLDVLWESLIDLKDDLSASTGVVMDLIAKLCSIPAVLNFMNERAIHDPSKSFSLLVPRLYPFLRHSITSVRISVLKALITFTSQKETNVTTWVDSKALRLIFQVLLAEQNVTILNLCMDLWCVLTNAFSKMKEKFALIFNPIAQILLKLILTPIGISRQMFPMDTSLLILHTGNSFSANNNSQLVTTTLNQKSALKITGRRGRPKDNSNKADNKANNKLNSGFNAENKTPNPTTGESASTMHYHNIDGPVFMGDTMLVGKKALWRTKIYSARAFGLALALLDDEELSWFKAAISTNMGSNMSSSRLCMAMVIEEFAKNTSCDTLSDFIIDFSLEVIANNSVYIQSEDLKPLLHSTRMSAQTLFNIFIDIGHISPSKIPQLPVVFMGDPDAGPNAFSLDSAQKIVDVDFPRLKKLLTSGRKVTAAKSLSEALNALISNINEAKEAYNLRITETFAALSGAIIAFKKLPKKITPVIKSLMDSLKGEENEDLQVRSAQALSNLVILCFDNGKNGAIDKIARNLCSFLCVDTSQVPVFNCNSSLETSIFTLKKEENKREIKENSVLFKEIEEAKIKTRGARLALENILLLMGPEAFVKVPKLKECMIDPLSKLSQNNSDNMLAPDSTLGQDIIDALCIIKFLLPSLHQDLYHVIIENFPNFVSGLKSKFSVIRYASAISYAAVCKTLTVTAMAELVENIIPLANNAANTAYRQGCIECIYHILSSMESDIVPYIVFLVVPVMGRMSDSNDDIRILSTTSFATLVKLMPLEAGFSDPPGLPKIMIENREKERKFLSQMMDPKKIEDFKLPVAIKAQLRKYQQEGVNWLAFLNRYKLHGILCDDMGLGKTLQTICIVASDHHLRAEAFRTTGAEESRRLPSLIICPTTLAGHWTQEFDTYAPFMSVLQYVGNPTTRAKLKMLFRNYDVVITSYDIARNDVEYISSFEWNYCVLDEGHIIKNSAAKLTQAVKRIHASHRLILSGTPIQNNVLELWSLFDFLMPGFLGTEKVYNIKFAKPISASRNAKSSSKDQESGSLALEALHKQALPFLLRRLKEDVLDDLPPKIIQDYYCDLSDIQLSLYEDFAKNQNKTISDDVASTGKENKQHIFQALQYLRKLCSHPALVLSKAHPKYNIITKKLAAEGKSIHDICFAPKMTALQSLLLDCGIGQATDDTAPVISQHRALVFFQLKDMLDIVENDLLKKLMPSVSYMRLDGSVDHSKRHAIVQKFNADPSIDLLLLTTHVGGLGLNLTGADTVIFVEHDWNPMKDHQAMDRAHRLGQKKVVNVYRLITRKTIEEKIMGLQRFKINVASTIINQQNSGLETMKTDELLDIFKVDETEPQIKKNEEDNTMEVANNLGQPGLAGNVGTLTELWDESEYQEEYNLDSFIKSLK